MSICLKSDGLPSAKPISFGYTKADDNCLQVRHVVRFNTDRTIFDDSVHLSDREVGIDTGMKNLPQ